MPEERAQLREDELERRLQADILNPAKTDAALDSLVRKSIKEHGA